MATPTVSCPVCNKSVSLNNLTKHFQYHPSIIREAKDNQTELREYIYIKFYQKDENENKCITCRKPTIFKNLGEGYFGKCLECRRKIQKEVSKYTCPICNEVVNHNRLKWHCQRKHRDIYNEHISTGQPVVKILYDKYQKQPWEGKCIHCGGETNWFGYTKGYVFICPKCTKKGNYNSDSALLKKLTLQLGSEDLARQRLQEIRGVQSKKAGKEYILDNFGEEEFMRRKVHTSLDAFQQKHGEEDGQKKYKEFCGIKSHQMSEKYYVDKYGEKDGKNRWEELKAKFRNNWVEIYKNRYPDFTEDQIRQKIAKDFNTVSLESFIGRYGEDKGLDRYNLYLKKLKESGRFSYGPISPKHIEFYDDMFNILNEYGIEENDILWGQNELRLKSDNGKSYKYDFTISKLKLIFEFNGDFWHMNPKLYHSKSVNRINNLIAQNIWDHDKEKTECAKRNGYDVVTVWEDDFKNKKEQLMKELKLKIRLMLSSNQRSNQQQYQSNQ